MRLKRIAAGVIIVTAVVMTFSIWYATRDKEYRTEKNSTLRKCVQVFHKEFSVWPSGKEDLLGCLTGSSKRVDWDRYQIRLATVEPQTVNDKVGELAIYEVGRGGKLSKIRIGALTPQKNPQSDSEAPSD